MSKYNLYSHLSKCEPTGTVMVVVTSECLTTYSLSKGLLPIRMNQIGHFPMDSDSSCEGTD